MTLVYTPASTLEFVRGRLRAYIHPKEIDDDELLRMAGEAYQRLCEESLALQGIVQIADIADVAEAALPSDHFRTIRVYRNGLRQQRLPDLLALSGKESGYYEYDGFLGVSPTPTQTGGGAKTWLLYARTPPLPASWSSGLDSDFPAEFSYAIVHYVHSRVSTAVGGESRLTQIAWHRSQYETAVTAMRRRVMTPNTAEVKRIANPRTPGVMRATRTVTSGEGGLIVVGAPPSGVGGAPAGDFVTQAQFNALVQDRAAYLGIAGTLTGTMTDATDFPFAVPFNATIIEMKATLKTATTTPMSVQLRRAADIVTPSYSDVTGWSITFPVGAKGGIADPVDTLIPENTVLNLTATNASGANLTIVVGLRPA